MTTSDNHGRQTTTMDKILEDQLRRLRSLCGSLECLITCALDLEDASQPLASSLFLLTEVKDAVERVELAASGSVIAPAND